MIRVSSRLQHHLYCHCKLIEEYQLDKKSHVIVQGSGGMAKAVVAAFKNSGFEHLKIFARNEKTGKKFSRTLWL